MEDNKERIAKVIARAGICSRRDAEKLIDQKRITLNGEIVQTPATKVSAKDKICVDGEALPQKEELRVWRFYKPVGIVTTNRDEKGRKTVFDILPSSIPRTVSVGRLDLNTEGLLLLTNDGTLAGKLENPKTGWIRRYRVRVHGIVNNNKIKKLEKGISIDGINYASIKATIDSTKGTNTWLTVSLTEGKNREIRKVMEFLGLSVNRLIRVSYGPFQLGNMKKGEISEISGKALREQLGSLKS
jgi:23S rRNA pseudouridine2605 synthase